MKGPIPAGFDHGFFRCPRFRGTWMCGPTSGHPRLMFGKPQEMGGGRGGLGGWGGGGEAFLLWGVEGRVIGRFFRVQLGKTALPRVRGQLQEQSASGVAKSWQRPQRGFPAWFTGYKEPGVPSAKEGCWGYNPLIGSPFSEVNPVYFPRISSPFSFLFFGVPFVFH